MPELPEVETTKRGIQDHVIGQLIHGVAVHEGRLRWPVPQQLTNICVGQRVTAVSRRAKYILLHMQSHSLLIHLGMSGSLRITGAGGQASKKHDHVEFQLGNACKLVFNDPRRFGCILLSPQTTTMQHKLLRNLGPEPLSSDFHSDYLYQLARQFNSSSKRRSTPVKSFIMDQRVVVGVGNIYANEALFASGIHPTRKAGNISKMRYANLTIAIKEILSAAINLGGTTLRDFVGGDGKPGYFQQTLQVYGRGSQECMHCQKVLTEIRLNQRSTVYCSRCQR